MSKVAVGPTDISKTVKPAKLTVPGKKSRAQASRVTSKLGVIALCLVRIFWSLKLDAPSFTFQDLIAAFRNVSTYQWPELT